MSEDDDKDALVVRDAASSELAARPWRGDEHKLQVAAATEAGLDPVQRELDLYTEGFKQGMTLQDELDNALVFRGRTVLKEKQLSKSLSPMLRFLKLQRDHLALRVHDGKFELRISSAAADAARPALDSAKVTLMVWIGAGLVGWLISQYSQPLTAIIWGLGLIAGGYVLRQGLISGRALLAARISLGLAMLAQEEQLILPPEG